MAGREVPHGLKAELRRIGMLFAGADHVEDVSHVIAGVAFATSIRTVAVAVV